MVCFFNELPVNSPIDTTINSSVNDYIEINSRWRILDEMENGK